MSAPIDGLDTNRATCQHPSLSQFTKRPVNSLLSLTDLLKNIVQITSPRKRYQCDMFCIISTHVGFYLFCLSFLNKTCNKKKRDIVKEKIVWLSRGYRTVLVNGFKIFNEVQVIFFIAIRDSNVKLKLVLLECLWNVFNKNRLNSSILDFSPLES